MDGKLKLESGMNILQDQCVCLCVCVCVCVCGGGVHGSSDAQKHFSLNQIKCVLTIACRFLRELDRSADQVAGSTPGKI